MKSKLKPENKLPKDLEKSCEELLANLQEMEDTEVMTEILRSATYAIDIFRSYLSTKDNLTTEEAEILGMCKMYIMSMAAMFSDMEDILGSLKDTEESTEPVGHEA